jgi:hypothetical protein
MTMMNQKKVTEEKSNGWRRRMECRDRYLKAKVQVDWKVGGKMMEG